MTLPHGRSLALRPFADGLIVTYLIDAGGHYTFIQNRHLLEDGIDLEQLHTHGVTNLIDLVNYRSLRVQPYQNIFAVLMVR
jgi:hypothetical protein